MATKSFGYGNFAEIRNKKLVVHKDDPLPESSKVKELKAILDSYIEPIRIENLLLHIQNKTNYLKAFKPLEGNRRRDIITPNILNVTITGHATNLGLYGLSRNCSSINGDKLSHVSNFYLNANNLKDASDLLIKSQQKYWLTAIIGSGNRSSSDGMRYKTSHRGLYSSMHPRYFGALDRGITVYTHMSDQCTVFNTEILSCAVREAVYVLDGLLDNQAISRPFEHSTDTAGFTEVLFALCYLLGISFQPHFKDLKDQQLYCFDRRATGHPELFSTEKTDEDLLNEQWDDIIRLVCSLKQGLIKPHIIVKKLHAQETFTKLSKALVQLGRIVKSSYILRYFHDIDLRYVVRKQLNRGESRHTLARYVFFADQGSFKTNDYEEMMNKASCLSFVSNAMVLWNTEQMQKVYEILNQKGFKAGNEDMARVLPLSTKNILVHGQYNFLKCKLKESLYVITCSASYHG
jgi:TnpA family transposase